jgi:hypothetical protein
MARPDKVKPKPEVASESTDEPMPFDDALRILLAAPPQHRTAKDKMAKANLRKTASRARKPDTPGER